MQPEPVQFRAVTPEQAEIVNDSSPAVLVCGPWGSGKTRAALFKVLAVCCQFPESVPLVGGWYRHTAKRLYSLFVDGQGGQPPVVPPEYVRHRNEQELVVSLSVPGRSEPVKVQFSGLKPQETKVFKHAGGEFSLVILDEATQIKDWQLVTELEARARRLPGARFKQIMFLCNADQPGHYLYQRFYEQKGAQKGDMLIEPPVIPRNAGVFDSDFYDRLDGLTGVLRLRYVENKWVAHEGLVYPYDPRVQVTERRHDGWYSQGSRVLPFPIPKHWRRVDSIDFGFDHPFVWPGWVIDPGDRWHLVRQIYMSRRTVEEHVPYIKENRARYDFTGAVVCDHDAEDRATLELHGIPTTPAYKDRLKGQAVVYDKFPHSAPGDETGETLTPCRVFFCADSLVEVDQNRKVAGLPIRTEDEFGTYVWRSVGKEDMCKEKDDGMDGMRYAMTVGMQATKRTIIAPLNPALAAVSAETESDFGAWMREQ